MLVSELYSDESSHDDIVDEIADVKKNIQALKKERTQVRHQIEGLMNDLECAQRAKEVSDAAAMRVLKKLQELFGEGFKTEDLVGKIVEIQERAKNGKKEVEELTDQLKREGRSVQISNTKCQHDNDIINKEIMDLKHKQEDLDEQIADTARKASVQQSKLQGEKDQYSYIKALKDSCNALNQNDTDEILRIVGENSDQKLSDLLKGTSDAVGITFNGDIPAFIQNLTQSINDMKNGYKDKISPNELQKQVRKTFQKLRDLKAKKKNLRGALRRLQVEANKDDEQDIEKMEEELNALIEKEKRKRKKRIILLQESLLRASRYAEVDYNIDQNDGMYGTCQSYINFASILEHEINQISQKRLPALDLTYLQRKVKNVKIQNTILCNRLKQNI